MFKSLPKGCLNRCKKTFDKEGHEGLSSETRGLKQLVNQVSHEVPVKDKLQRVKGKAALLQAENELSKKTESSKEDGEPD